MSWINGAKLITYALVCVFLMTAWMWNRGPASGAPETSRPSTSAPENASPGTSIPDAPSPGDDARPRPHVVEFTDAARPAPAADAPAPPAGGAPVRSVELVIIGRLQHRMGPPHCGFAAFHDTIQYRVVGVHHGHYDLPIILTDLRCPEFYADKCKRQGGPQNIFQEGMEHRLLLRLLSVQNTDRKISWPVPPDVPVYEIKEILPICPGSDSGR